MKKCTRSLKSPIFFLTFALDSYSCLGPFARIKLDLGLFSPFFFCVFPVSEFLNPDLFQIKSSYRMMDLIIHSKITKPKCFWQTTTCRKIISGRIYNSLCVCFTACAVFPSHSIQLNSGRLWRLASDQYL